jgi:ABC-type dipeptide/oligopeptide/nickel transport system permease component
LKRAQFLGVVGSIGRAVIILLIAGLFGAMLIRMAPGYQASEQELDPRLSRSSLEALRNKDAEVSYIQFLLNLAHGDAGTSRVFKQPVTQLIRERASTTVRSVALGWTAAWVAAFLLAAAVALKTRAITVFMSTMLSGMLLSVPSAVLATLCLVLDLPPAVPIAAVVFPRVFPYLYEQLRSSVNRPHVVMARARGLSGARLFFWHMLPGVLGGILGLAGVSVTLALGASIPVEALADSPGLGQLAWRAALGRDLPVLAAITLLLTAVTVVVNLVSDVAVNRLGARAQ